MDFCDFKWRFKQKIFEETKGQPGLINDEIIMFFEFIRNCL